MCAWAVSPPEVRVSVIKNCGGENEERQDPHTGWEGLRNISFLSVKCHLPDSSSPIHKDEKLPSLTGLMDVVHPSRGTFCSNEQTYCYTDRLLQREFPSLLPENRKGKMQSKNGI